MPRFYIDHIINIGEEIALPKNIVQHLNVIRVKQHDFITLFNGDGYSYRAKIIALNKNSALVIIQEQHNSTTLNSINLHLGLSIIASDKMDLAVRSATELNVVTITPIISTYTQKISSERLANRLEHWQKVILSSCEQCGQNNIPRIVPPLSFNDFMQRKNTGKFILSLYQHDPNFHIKTFKEFQDITLLVGPEGGFTESEVDLAKTSGYIALKPWHNILRAETAVAAGISLILNNLNFTS